MTNKEFKITGRIVNVEYKSTSCYGNPKYKIWFEQLNEAGEVVDAFHGETANNAACAYGIQNPCYKQKAVIKYHTTKSGNNIITYCYGK